MAITQYLRRCSLIVADDTGAGLDLSEFRIKFHVSKAAIQFPNVLVAKVYNLSDDTANRIQKEFTQVVLQAGYEDNIGIVFSGTVRQVFTGRENGVDKFLAIVAADGDMAYNFAVVNTTLAAGATASEQVNAAAIPMVPMGVTPGYIAPLPGQQLPRGKVMYGMSRDYLRQTTASTDTNWSIQDGKLQVVPNLSVLPSDIVALNTRSGMIGTPTQTNQGINIQCLINSVLKVSGRVKINEQEIQKQVIDVNATFGSPNIPAKISDDGVYQILSVEHDGDTRGQEWYTSLICVDIDDTSPIRGSVRL